MRAFAAASLLALVAGSAAAHEPYLLPNLFDASNRDHVTVEASFTEDLFRPDVVMKSEDWQAIGPDGVVARLTPVYLKDLAVLEVPTPADGTYRLSSGVRVGRIAKAALVKGEWVFLDPSKPAPEGATPVDMQSITLTEVYVSRGKPTDAALKPRGQGLEIRAVTHPSSIVVGAPAQFEVLADGQPVAGQTVTVTPGDRHYGAAALPEVKTGADGRFAVTAPKAGVYHLMTRHRIGPAIPGGPHRSLTYALTLEADE
jgi:uncharacterized GH25 family protein